MCKEILRNFRLTQILNGFSSWNVTRGHWKPVVAMMPTVLSLVAPHLVFLKTYGATSKDYVAIVKTAIQEKAHGVLWQMRAGNIAMFVGDLHHHGAKWWLGGTLVPSHHIVIYDNQGWFRFAPSQWETSLQSNAVCYWLGANLESDLLLFGSAELTMCGQTYQCRHLAGDIFKCISLLKITVFSFQISNWISLLGSNWQWRVRNATMYAPPSFKCYIYLLK